MYSSVNDRIDIKNVEEFLDERISAYFDQENPVENISREAVELFAECGFLGAAFPVKFGGDELDPVQYGHLTETVGKYSNSLRTLMTVHSSLVGESILRWGSKEQVENWIPKLCTGEKIAAFALSEKDHGSNSMDLRTSYKVRPDGYEINGEKMWISYGAIADVFLVFASTGSDITAFLVERDLSGVSVEPINGMMSGRDNIARIRFDNVTVPEDAVIGPVGTGLGGNVIVSSALDHGRYSVAWGAVAVAQSALDASIDYSKSRKQFGRRIGEFQLIKGLIADSATEVRAARSLCIAAGKLRSKGSPQAAVETTVAKYFSSKVAVDVTGRAVQVHGANGLHEDYIVGRLFREAKVFELIEGTSQIQQELIANHCMGLNA